MEKTVFIELARLLEDWGLMIVEPADSSFKTFNQESDFYLASIKFKGAVNGEYQVLTQSEFANALVSNLLGEDLTDDVESASRDALCEMANVMSGNLLTTCYGEETVFELTSPTVKELSKDEAKEFFKKPVFCYLADDCPVGFSFSLDV